MLRHNNVFFYKDHSNPLFKDLRFLKLYKVLESEVIKFFYKFSTSELPKSGFSQFNLVHVVHTCKKRNNLLIYIPRMSTLKYGSHFLRGVMVLLYGTNSFKIFFQAMNWCPSLTWSHFLWNISYKLTKINCKLFLSWTFFYEMQSSY